MGPSRRRAAGGSDPPLILTWIVLPLPAVPRDPGLVGTGIGVMFPAGQAYAAPMVNDI